MYYKYFNGILALVILVFSFWQIEASYWIIVAAAAVILIKSVVGLGGNGSAGEKPGKKSGEKKIGVEAFGAKGKKENVPSKEEIKEVMKGKKK